MPRLTCVSAGKPATLVPGSDAPAAQESRGALTGPWSLLWTPPPDPPICRRVQQPSGPWKGPDVTGAAERSILRAWRGRAWSGALVGGDQFAPAEHVTAGA
jgi:hypothetical protein